MVSRMSCQKRRSKRSSTSWKSLNQKKRLKCSKPSPSCQQMTTTTTTPSTSTPKWSSKDRASIWLDSRTTNWIRCGIFVKDFEITTFQLLSRLVVLKEQATAQKEAAEMALKGEAEEAAPLDALTGDQAEVLKKDAEELGDIRLGLDNVPHKIVKGGNAAISRVVGNRVYLKVCVTFDGYESPELSIMAIRFEATKFWNIFSSWCSSKCVHMCRYSRRALSKHWNSKSLIQVNVKQEEQLYPLIEFLQKTIALPNDLIFDDFQFENGQLSMRISRFEGAKPKSAKRIDSVGN